MRLAFLMELVVAAGVGLGLARETDVWLRGPMSSAGWVTWSCLVGGNFLEAFGLVVGLGTWLESLRRKGPDVWGPGRWAWSVAAASLVLAYLSFLSVHEFRGGEGLAPWSYSWAIGRRFLQPTAVSLAALAVTGAVARLRHRPGPDPGPDSDPDARERAGRLYAAVVIVAAVLGSTLLAFRFDPGASFSMVY